MSIALKRILHDKLLIRLARLGFEPVSPLVFRRKVRECTHLITAASRMEDGKLKFTCTLGLQFETLELLMNGKVEKSLPSIVCPIHLLADSREFYEWEFSNDAEAAVSADSFLAEFAEVGEPFFEKFGNLDAVIHELRENRASQWLVVAQHQRIGILATYEVIQGRREAAQLIFKEALGDPTNQNPGRKHRLEELRKQLLA